MNYLTLRDIYRIIKYRDHTLPELIELNEMLIKFGRRVTHDLEHAVSELSRNKDSYLYPTLKVKVRYWRNVFYADKSGKNYRSEIYRNLDKAEKEIERLKNLCESHGIDHTDPNEMPL